MDIDDTVDAFTKEYNTKYEKTYLQLIVHSVLNEFKKVLILHMCNYQNKHLDI